jgi:hypothetical protein
MWRRRQIYRATTFMMPKSGKRRRRPSRRSRPAAHPVKRISPGNESRWCRDRRLGTDVRTLSNSFGLARVRQEARLGEAIALFERIAGRA